MATSACISVHLPLQILTSLRLCVIFYFGDTFSVWSMATRNSKSILRITCFQASEENWDSINSINHLLNRFPLRNGEISWCPDRCLGPTEKQTKGKPRTKHFCGHYYYKKNDSLAFWSTSRFKGYCIYTYIYIYFFVF